MTARNSAAASANRGPAPHKGASSRLLNRTHTALPPASTAYVTNAVSATRSPSEVPTNETLRLDQLTQPRLP